MGRSLGWAQYTTMKKAGHCVEHSRCAIADGWHLSGDAATLGFAQECQQGLFFNGNCCSFWEKPIAALSMCRGRFYGGGCDIAWGRAPTDSGT